MTKLPPAPPNATAKDTTPFQLDGTYSYNRLIRDTEGAALLGCSKATFWRRVSDGTLPPAIKIGGISRWKLSEILDRIEVLRSQQLTESHSIKPNIQMPKDGRVPEGGQS